MRRPPAQRAHGRAESLPNSIRATPCLLVRLLAEAGIEGDFIFGDAGTCGGETSSVIVSRIAPSCVMLHRTYTRDAVTITDTFFVVCSNLLIAFAFVDVWLRRGITSRVGEVVSSLSFGRAVAAATEVRL